MNREKITHLSLLLLLVAVCLFAYAVATLPACGYMMAGTSARTYMPHDCCGDSCFICLCNSLCERLASFLFLPAVVGIALPLLLKLKIAIYDAADGKNTAHTLVCLKVKLSN